MSNYTNFNGYSHGDLRGMVHAMDSGGIMSAGDPWRKAADTLKQIRATLNTASGDATSSWEGSSSDAFYSKMTKLANSVNNVAAYANDAAITMKMMSEAIDQAKHDMPEEPSFWDKVGDAVGDTAQSAVGINNENTNTTVTDERKAKAVAVMEILATKYRAGAAALKVPKTTDVGSGAEDIQPPDEPTGSAAIAALIMGSGMGAAAAKQSQQPAATSSRPSAKATQRTPQAPKAVAEGPTDSGIKGGTANPLPKPEAPGRVSPGTGIDGVSLATPPSGTGGGGLVQGASEGGGTGGLNGGLGGGTQTIGGVFGGKAGIGGGRGGVFGAGGVQGAGGSAGSGGAGGRTGASLGRRSGSVVGEAGSGTTGRRGFTEGGSGIGRGRGQVGQGAGGQGHDGMPGGTQAKKKDKKKGKERPDYLVEDEETWMSGDTANPNVVE